MGLFAVVASSGMLPLCDGAMVERGARTEQGTFGNIMYHCVEGGTPKPFSSVRIEGLEARWRHDSYCGRKDT